MIQNLLQAQVEFYFSDYNLKRDKRLLCDVAAPPKKGFLALEEVMKLSRIRQLCSEIETLEEALRRSAILTLIREKISKDEMGKVKGKKAISSGSDGDDEAEDDVKESISESTKSDDKSDKKNKNLAALPVPHRGTYPKPKEVKPTEKATKVPQDEGYRIWVGRANFEKPREKEFPFRRTVFLFGIPCEKSQEFVNEMLKPFGSISKTQFDLSPDGIDRKIGHRFLNKPRVYTLYYFDPNKVPGSSRSGPGKSNVDLWKINGLGGGPGLDPEKVDDSPAGGAIAGGAAAGGVTAAGPTANLTDDEYLPLHQREEMIFKTSYEGSDGKPLATIKCHKCGKIKAVSEGFYTTTSWQVIYCSQCAAQLAEDQLNLYYKERTQYQHLPRHKWLGPAPDDQPKRRTALVVFASQRQASKCAYVRTRIAHKGAFATHFHHYSKVKKEVVLSESDQNPKDSALFDDNEADANPTKNDSATTTKGTGDGQKKSGSQNRGNSKNSKNSGSNSSQQQQGGNRGNQQQNQGRNMQSNRGGSRGGGSRGMPRGYGGGMNRRGNFQQNRGGRGRGNYRGSGGGQRGGGGYGQRGWGGNQMRNNSGMYQGRGGRGGQMMMNQQHYGYGQQQQGGMGYHGHPQGPQGGGQQKQNQRLGMKGPGLYRQSSAPTTSRQ